MFIIPNITRDLVLWIRRRYGMSKFRKYTSCVCLFYLYPTMDFSLGLYDNRVTFSVRMYIFAGEKKWKTFFQWSFLFIDWRKKNLWYLCFIYPIIMCISSQTVCIIIMLTLWKFYFSIWNIEGYSLSQWRCIALCTYTYMYMVS